MSTYEPFHIVASAIQNLTCLIDTTGSDPSAIPSIEIVIYDINGYVMFSYVKSKNLFYVPNAAYRNLNKKDSTKLTKFTEEQKFQWSLL
ncbi:hypothetical protein [Trabulsiella odontotermitis]|uniref:Uncharacterized protein n=1 Tax=Trabulsiella odontotermitis TaxID=379893 RepID=A0A0L0GXS0_9ENTR|nr:hypothetical protein [Trabulsiella odontotermitis]KNC94015.1 hypothetical protein GM31_16735 [Trabulsiella odontotermitis]